MDRWDHAMLCSYVLEDYEWIGDDKQDPHCVITSISDITFEYKHVFFQCWLLLGDGRCSANCRDLHVDLMIELENADKVMPLIFSCQEDRTFIPIVKDDILVYRSAKSL